MKASITQIEELDAKLCDKPPQEILRAAFERHGSDIALAFSGAEDVVLLDMATQVCDDVRVFCIDTGRLHAETLTFIERVRQRYPIELEVLFPERGDVEALVRDKGLFSFLSDGHRECCGIRKVAPLRRKLAGLSAWVTGQRRDQSPETREMLAVVELDTTLGDQGGPLVKYNPLANWTAEQVWDHIRTAAIPFNPLHDQGFKSIGCAPCTRPTSADEHEREGRWWWENADHKECGLHLRDRG
jgi:phosphoadenosine phosphosulfate reductase